jgi:putative NIF3 family GTP cyclohydrolase 1 type 2
MLYTIDDNSNYDHTNSPNGVTKMAEIQNVIQALLQSVEPLKDTVDTVKSGEIGRKVTGIAVTFMATYEVIERAAKAGANLIITHEPTFFNHLDETDWLELDEVYQAKRRLIEDAGVTIFRFHDYCHRHVPDFILAGLLKALGWEKYANKTQPTAPLLVNIPTASLSEVVNHVKQSLGIPFVRVVGNDSLLCSKVGLFSGYGGVGRRTIPFAGRENLDLIIAGEGPEWETPEYVRDAVQAGFQKAFILLGHQKSEEAGMEYVADYLKPLFPDVPVMFFGTEPALRAM